MGAYSIILHSKSSMKVLCSSRVNKFFYNKYINLHKLHYLITTQDLQLSVMAIFRTAEDIAPQSIQVI